MTKDEINRKISEAKGKWFRKTDDCPDWDLHPMWVQNHGYCKSCDRPVDWTGSEEASAELLDEMPSPCLTHVIEPDDIWICWPDHRRHMRSAQDKDRKTAVALASMKWKGIDVQ